MTPSQADSAKRAAAARALEYVEDGMTLGLGSGSTAKWFVDLLAPHLAETGKKVTCVATSSATRAQAEGLGISLADLDDAGGLDLTVDGADEIDGLLLDMIKGGGGALLQEKIVANASERLVIIADESKVVDSLGAFALPVEVARFGCGTTADKLRLCLKQQDVGGHRMRLREKDGEPFVTDGGHYILDLDLGRIGDPETLDFELDRIPGVVENGLFVGMADLAIIGRDDGSTRILTGTGEGFDE